ncbi:histidine--tRNA ligase [Candidatus Uhrbacteria bacterium RIFCSPLOWO2_02_FULL_49_11]|uniref:Histidine--tRNA ligase n=1 Tax=Candidatus Uhrbacteria bacterium RIFCSPLOWO2_02_FULL_49_11 TaxID=1802409 RepID=A0A1F7VDE1_9BACT|nr:MAG: histidine--tRNA ligase [Candidatus Uhrbacteria bacterium RIFCSPLOWO2_02_FULL_49_11]
MSQKGNNNMKAKSAPPEEKVESSLPAQAGAKDAKVQTIRGMRDVLPEEYPLWSSVFQAVERVAQDFRYERILVPLVEATGLFSRSVGTETDIVEKEMYTFNDRGGENITLRPEFTASIARAYIEHGMHARPQPVRLWDMGPAFRYDRPQAGRHRQFWQYDFEVLGDGHPIIDAQLIAALTTLYNTLSVPVTIAINSIGEKACRPAYIKALVDYLSSHRSSLCEDCGRRMETNPLRALDCKEPECQRVLAQAPQIVDWLCENCREHFVKVLEYLDELEAPYYLEPRLVRGLDYYTRTTFEVMAKVADPSGIETEGEGIALAIGGGGRYDTLVAELGGRATPAVGFAGGVERLILAMQRSGFSAPPRPSPQLFLAQLGNEARKKTLSLSLHLRRAGYTVADQFSKDGLSQQLEVAARLGCRYTLILGQKELLDCTIIIRDMESGIQEIVDYAKVIQEIEKRFSRKDLLAKKVSLPPPLNNDMRKPDLKREEYLLKESFEKAEGEEIVVESESMSIEEITEEIEGVETDGEEKYGSGLKWVPDSNGVEYGDEEKY